MDNLNRLRTKLEKLGTEHKQWQAKIPQLQALVRQADAAGMAQTEIVELSGYKRDNIRLLCMPEEQREEIRARRRKPATESRKALSQKGGPSPELVEQMERTAADPAARVKRGRPRRKEG